MADAGVTSRLGLVSGALERQGRAHVLPHLTEVLLAVHAYAPYVESHRELSPMIETLALELSQEQPDTVTIWAIVDRLSSDTQKVKRLVAAVGALRAAVGRSLGQPAVEAGAQLEPQG